MRFAFTEDQLAFRDAVADLLAKECPPEVVRAAWPAGTDAHGARKGEGARADADRLAKVWSDLAEMGVLGIGVSEANGGLGMAETDWILLAEETGYAALPHPFVETACVVAPLLDDVDDPHGVLGELVDGSRQAGAIALNGSLVPWGDAVTYLVTVDRRGSDGWVVRRIEGGLAVGDTADQRRTLADAVDAGRRVVRLGAWRSDAGFALGTIAERAFDRGALGTAAQLVGLSRRMLDLTVAYASERKQFGVAIGSQQAVKHHLADAAMAVRFAAPVVYAAAWELATGQPTAGRTVSTAKALASDAARLTARQALQCHGAIGYTVEYDLHLYLKRAEALSRTWGDASWHRRRVAAALGI
ncbi:MAG: acyl-CoA/acyl-ACP dehydrogenase [Acidimicrobiales bacterium]|nr:acyl-CoA/acyl-ACP dehydrogenase [Acidimicrobiales bacterium]